MGKWKKRLLALGIVISVLFVLFIYPFSLIVIDYQSETVPSVGSTTTYFIQRCNSQDAMEGRTILYETRYHPQDPVFNGEWATGHDVATVLADWWSSAPNSHQIAVEYANKTAFDYWERMCQNASTRNYTALYNSLVWQNASDFHIQGFVLWQHYFSYGSIGTDDPEYPVVNLMLIGILALATIIIILALFMYLYYGNYEDKSHLLPFKTCEDDNLIHKLDNLEKEEK